MTDKEFVNNYNELTEDERRAYNEKLCEQYPFLKFPTDDYSFTWLDDMPNGWRKAFGIELCEKIKNELIKFNFLNEYRIVQIKEKYGELRWYDNGIPKDSKIYEIIEEYTERSFGTCIECGKPATCYSTGWISPYCKECIGDKPYKEFEED